MEVKRVPQKSLTNLEEHWCHRRNVKYLGVAQINSRLRTIPLHWLQNNSLFPIIHDKWLDFLQANRNSLRHTSSVYRNTNFSTGTRGKLHAPHIISRRSWFPVFYWTVRPTLNKHLKRSLPSPIDMWEGHWVFSLKWSGYRDSLTRNKVGFPWSGLNAGSSFIWQDVGMSESCVETLEKARVLRLIWIGGITSIWYLERQMEFKASKGDDAWHFLKIDRNPNISVETRKGPLVSHLNSSSVCIILPSLV